MQDINSTDRNAPESREGVVADYFYHAKNDNTGMEVCGHAERCSDEPFEEFWERLKDYILPYLLADSWGDITFTQLNRV